MFKTEHPLHSGLQDMAAKKKKHYIDNKEFENLIILYKTDNTKETEDRLFEIFDLLIVNVYQTFKFEVNIDDAKQECFVLLLRTLKNFIPVKGKAFNYFTTVILNNLKLIYTKNSKYYSKLEPLDFKDD